MKAEDTKFLGAVLVYYFTDGIIVQPARNSFGEVPKVEIDHCTIFRRLDNHKDHSALTEEVFAEGERQAVIQRRDRFKPPEDD